MKHERELTPSEAKRPDHNQPTLEVGKDRGGVPPPEPTEVQPPVESAEGNASTPLTPEQQRRREKKLAYDQRFYQVHREQILEQTRRRYQNRRQEKLAYRENYRKGHKKEIRVYQREYMRDYREGKRRRLQAEPPKPTKVFSSPGPS